MSLRYLFGFGLCLLMFMLYHCAGMRSNPRFKVENEKVETNGSNHTGAPATTRFEKRLLDQIQAYMGVPYKWGGKSARGMDCSGFVSTVYKKAANVRLPHNSARMFKRGQPVSEAQLRVGDLVFFENIESVGISHVGIYIGDSKFAHASTTRGVVVSGLDDTYYRQRYVDAKRIYHD